VFYLVIYMISGLCVYLLCLLRLKEKIDRKHNKELGDLALLKTRIKVWACAFH
jgi:hypothetical protein